MKTELTPRLRELCILIKTDPTLTNKEYAQKMNVKEKTIKWMKSKLFILFKSKRHINLSRALESVEL